VPGGDGESLLDMIRMDACGSCRKRLLVGGERSVSLDG